MSSVGEIKAELESAKAAFNDAPFMGVIQGLVDARTAGPEKKVYDAFGALEPITTLLPAYATDAYQAKTKAEEGAGQVQAATEAPEELPNELIMAALAGAIAMAHQAEVASGALGRMDEHLGNALGHLLDFVESMQLYDNAWVEAATAARAGLQAQTVAVESTEAYIQRLG